MIATFDNTVGILVKAYLDGTLLKGDCQACAVGNICAAALGLRLTVNLRAYPELDKHIRGDAHWNDGDVSAEWGAFFMTGSNQVQQVNEVLAEVLEAGFTEQEMLIGKLQLAATGYRIDQLARIEYAFETAAPGYSEAAEFAGLMAVVDVLAEIHGVDLRAATAAKALFVHA